jgi:predicted DNA-binding transcriptional regulator YafY
VNENEQIATILLHAAAFGDAEAARRFHVSTRTIRRYRVRLQTDADLAAHVREQTDAHEAELGAHRVRFLRKALAEMERRLGLPDTKLTEIAEAVRVVGEMHQVAEAMGDGGSDGDDPEALEAPGGDSGQAQHAH